MPGVATPAHRPPSRSPAAARTPATQIEGKPFTPAMRSARQIRIVTDQGNAEAPWACRSAAGARSSPADLAARRGAGRRHQRAAGGLPGPAKTRLASASTWTAGPTSPNGARWSAWSATSQLGSRRAADAGAFLPYTQPPPSSWNTFQRSWRSSRGRSDGDPRAMPPSLRRAVGPSTRVAAVRTCRRWRRLIAARGRHAIQHPVLSLLARPDLAPRRNRDLRRHRLFRHAAHGGDRSAPCARRHAAATC